ncbi:amidohydrolase family protein [Roseobacter weihaiensis]|uniref:amidohydrolase family protein n=1 Tax=Roseobacter weihaiensis TaxID=2763262 RepID=UPI001D0AC1E5|nr:amidohydrolase family protein [Roseobacter sp. H9]
MHKTLIGGGLVLVDNAQFAQVSLLIEQGVIEAVMPAGEAVAEAQRLDASGRLIIPGLVNGHTHSHGALGRGGVSDLARLETFLAESSWLNMNRQTDDLRLCAELSAVELIRKGCTACFDMFIELPGPSVDGIHTVAEAYDSIGLRAVVAPMIADQTIYQALPGLLDAFDGPLGDAVGQMRMPKWQDTLQVCHEALRRWPAVSDRVRPGIGPTIPLHCSEDFLKACAALSHEGCLPLQTHLAETRLQQIMAQRKFGMSLTEHLDDLGMLSSHFSGAHGVWLAETEMRLLAQQGAGICHNPMSNLRLGSGIAPVRRMQDAGICMGLGTDASNTSDGQNMFEAMRLAATLSRAQDDDPTRWLRTADAFRMATEGSARLLALNRVGKIAPGWAADLVFLDLGYCHYTPLRSPLDQIVLAENGAALREVMIAGRTVFAEGQVLTIDETALSARAQAAAGRLDHANQDTRLMCQAAATVVQSFCQKQCARNMNQQRKAP